MKHNSVHFEQKYERGSMLVELLLSVALAAVTMPFIFKYQQNAILRAENIAVTNQMAEIQTALERYIVANRAKLLQTVGKNITRVDIGELTEFGLSDVIAQKSDKYQIRILKSSERGDNATLQGIIVFSSDDVSPLRTREIVSTANGDMGYVDGTRAYGTFGAWRTNTVDLGINTADGIISRTSVGRDNALYLWRVPSDSASDATMLSPLNLGGHDIEHAKFVNATTVQFDETLKLGQGASENVIFQNRTSLDNTYETQSAVVSGTLSSDARNMQVSGTVSLADIGKFSSFTTDDLWTNNLTLSGVSIDSGRAAVLKVNQSVDMTSGRISAIYATVGFAGSITPRLVVFDRIEDSINPAYYWDVKNNTANLLDITFAELNHMAPLALRSDGRGTTAYQIFSAVVTNKNATVSDYMNAITEIQNKVTAKYRLLNLE